MDLVFPFAIYWEEISPSTGSMISIPKPLKYLKPHYSFLCPFFEKLTKDSDIQKKFADILSVLAMTIYMRDQHNAEHEAVDVLTEGLELELRTNRAFKENGMLGDNFGFHLTNMLGNLV
ncbi:26S proteasome non-ATPase regulatory subunit 2 1B [Acorus gramineus]|uniref:26S proteasome non-ATPase regulatory subunit 2 1B n=1 Tax=Acorus gramineus TaxID=55184 RepID=A0AAV9B121_ACOGR|nr:26S proteasome non-ATPase regulatory subunit 2 1B [Acorus gramineus]